MHDDCDIIQITRKEYNDLIAAKAERNKLARELRNTIKRNEINLLHIETQTGLTNMVAAEKLKLEMYTQLLLESCPVLMFVFDEKLKFLLGTQSITRIIDVDNISFLRGIKLDRIVDKYNLSVFTSEIIILINNMVSNCGYTNFETKREVATKDNKRYEISILPFHKDVDGFAGVLVVVHDITELMTSRDTIQMLRDKAAYDGLTRIYNHVTFKDLASEFINRANREQSSACLFVIDVDFFKRVNDTYGHACGDLVLQKTSNIIRGVVRSGDLFGRLGGEEFGVLITGVSESVAMNLAEKIRASIHDSTILYKCNSIKVTVSVGVSLSYPGSVQSYESLFEQADNALYQAKKCGRNLAVRYRDSYL